MWGVLMYDVADSPTMIICDLIASTHEIPPPWLVPLNMGIHLQAINTIAGIPNRRSQAQMANHKSAGLLSTSGRCRKDAVVATTTKAYNPQHLSTQTDKTAAVRRPGYRHMRYAALYESPPNPPPGKKQFRNSETKVALLASRTPS